MKTIKEKLFRNILTVEEKIKKAKIYLSDMVDFLKNQPSKISQEKKNFHDWMVEIDLPEDKIEMLDNEFIDNLKESTMENQVKIVEDYINGKMKKLLNEKYTKPTLPNPIKMEVYLDPEADASDFKIADVWYDYDPYDPEDYQPHADLKINSIMIDGVERIKDVAMMDSLEEELWELIGDNLQSQADDYDDTFEQDDGKIEESISDTSDWTITVHKSSGEKVKEYVIKGKTEAEAKKEASDKIKGNKEIRATFHKVKENIEEAVRPIFTSEDGRFKYSITKNVETGEWVAKAYVDGKYDEDKTIYETDKEAAIASAQADMKRWNELHKSLKEDAENDDYFEKGDVLKVSGYTSAKGKGLSYNSMDAIALEGGSVGSWDVVDVKNIKTGQPESIYSFSITSYRPQPIKEVSEKFINRALKFLGEDMDLDFPDPTLQSLDKAAEEDYQEELAAEELAAEKSPDDVEESFNDWWNRVDEIQVLEFYDEHTGQMNYEIHGLNTENEDDIYGSYLSAEKVKELIGDNWKKYKVQMWESED